MMISKYRCADDLSGLEESRKRFTSSSSLRLSGAVFVWAAVAASFAIRSTLSHGKCFGKVERILPLTLIRPKARLRRRGQNDLPDMASRKALLADLSGNLWNR